jgi:hypothetical protein
LVIFHLAFSSFHLTTIDGAIFVNTSEFWGTPLGQYPERSISYQMENGKWKMTNAFGSLPPALHQLIARPYNPKQQRRTELNCIHADL